MFGRWSNNNNDVNNLGTIEGRFEIVNQNPLKVLDGAHNLDGIKHFFKDYDFNISIVVCI